MGCDIHLVLEVRDKDSGVWVGLHNFPYLKIGTDTALLRIVGKQSETEMLYWRARSRNYSLFASLAGVRGDGPEARGLPPDASTLARLHLADDGDLHSHTWYPLKDAVLLWVAAYGETPKAVQAKLLGNDSWMTGAASLWFGIDNDWTDEIDWDSYRLCIAFDN